MRTVQAPGGENLVDAIGMREQFAAVRGIGGLGAKIKVGGDVSFSRDCNLSMPSAMCQLAGSIVLHQAVDVALLDLISNNKVA